MTLAVAWLAPSGLVRAAGPRLIVEPRALDFGKLGHDTRANGKITIRNAGDANLVISKIKESCSCIKFRPAALAPIPPGESRTIDVTMSSGRALGRLVKKISIESNDPARPRLDVPVGMRVHEGYELSVREARFVGICGGEPRTIAIDVKRSAGGRGPPPALELEGFRVRFGKSKPEHFSASVSAIEGGRRVTVRLDPDHPEGRINAELRATLDGKTLTIPVVGEMFAWILVEPTFLSYRIEDSRPQSRENSFRLSSTDGTPFRIVDIQAEPSRGECSLDFDIRVEPGTLAYTVRVTATPGAKRESFYGKIHVFTDHPEKPELTLSYSGFFARAPRRGR